MHGLDFSKSLAFPGGSSIDGIIYSVLLTSFFPPKICVCETTYHQENATLKMNEQ